MNFTNPKSLIDSTIFKAYDIRGLYPSQLDEDAAFRIGWAFARSGYLRSGRPVVVGRDMRNSSAPLFAALAKGLNTAGVSVIDIGLCTTPMLYFAVNVLRAAGGAMITASHNPAGYNGFKLVRDQAIPISTATGLGKICHLAEDGSMNKAAEIGSIRCENLKQRYCDFFGRRFSVRMDTPVVIDAGNGMAGAILPEVLKGQNILHENLFFDLDGNFPHHEANPLKEENLQDVKKVMANLPGSIGIAFDGDGDRVGFIDETGKLIPGDLLTGLIAERVLREKRSGTILYDLRSSRVVPEIIRAQGGCPVRTRVGHSFIKQIMRDQGGLFAGELSCHFYFSDFFCCESGIFAMLELLQIVADAGKTLKALVQPLRKYAQSGEINFPVVDQRLVMDKVKKQFANGRITYLDGISVDYEDWWFNLRASNTEPLLRLNLEAKTEELMEEKLAEVSKLFERSK